MQAAGRTQAARRREDRQRRSADDATAQAGLTLAAWYWLLDQGWREEPYVNDRRAYRELPPSRVAELCDASDRDERSQLLQLAIAEAKFRPALPALRRHSSGIA